MDLAVTLGRLALQNPIMVASGTFGYGHEFESILDLARLGAIIPKTVTLEPRVGNPPPRTVETAAGLLNSIGLDNDGIDYFVEHHLPRLASYGTAIIANIAGRTADEFVRLAAQLAGRAELQGIELNISCPNVSGGVDFGTNPELTGRVVHGVRQVCDFAVIAKLTPNVTNIVEIADAARAHGADAVSLVNTFQGMAVDWRRRRPILGANTGGLSGPAIKPLALRIVWQVASSVAIPIIGVGGIHTADDCLEFLVAGASAVQIGTANFFDPTASVRLINQLGDLLAAEGLSSPRAIVGSLKLNDPAAGS